MTARQVGTWLFWAAVVACGIGVLFGFMTFVIVWANRHLPPI
ncbi:MAG TPA: hypothetical protein VFA27_07890 [Vicinamibacterales bacterium]|nr:hypothetical protein [Vicinamibacterales bacterium]